MAPPAKSSKEQKKLVVLPLALAGPELQDDRRLRFLKSVVFSFCDIVGLIRDECSKRIRNEPKYVKHNVTIGRPSSS